MNTGFTLLETLLVVSIIGLMLAIVAPSLPPPGIDYFLPQILAQIEDARINAIESGVVVYLEIDPPEEVMVEMSEPIYFYPNGHCNEVTITLSLGSECIILRSRSFLGDFEVIKE